MINLINSSRSSNKIRLKRKVSLENAKKMSKVKEVKSVTLIFLNS